MAKLNVSNSNQAGLSLLGVVIAVFILTTIILAVTSLLARTEKIVGISREKFEATNLAREGLELVQSQRDTNWLASGTPKPYWTDQLCQSGAPDVRPLAIDAVTSITIVPDPTPAQQKLYRDNGHLTHIISANETPYSRLITIDCADHEIDPTVDPPKPLRISVTSRVFWNHNGQPQEVVLTSNLYDWLQESMR